MEDANNRGDSRGVYRTVKVLARKTEKPPTNLKTDGQGNVLSDAADVAARWYGFLKSKFSATAVEQGRDPMEALPSTVGQGELTDEEVQQGLTRRAQSSQQMSVACCDCGSCAPVSACGYMLQRETTLPGRVWP